MKLGRINNIHHVLFKYYTQFFILSLTKVYASIQLYLYSMEPLVYYLQVNI